MTQSNPYLETLMRAGMVELKKFCGAITEYIGGLVECSPVPGISGAYGQEYKVILTFLPSAYSQTLVRAYLNEKGKPYLDVSDKKGPQKCKDVADFARRLNEYLKVPTVLATLDTFRREVEARRLGE
jgi:hypothetical protein